jgi:hypothetical protein
MTTTTTIMATTTTTTTTTTHVAGEDLAARRLDLLQVPVEALDAARQRTAERLLLVRHDLLNVPNGTKAVAMRSA